MDRGGYILLTHALFWCHVAILNATHLPLLALMLCVTDHANRDIVQ